MGRSNPSESNDLEIIIPVIGATGAGKSAFINAAAGKYMTAVGSMLQSCTKEVKPVTLRRGDGRRITLVDTPGFNDTAEDDPVILSRIIGWLTQLDQDGGKLAGIIYLHEVDQCRMLASFGSLSMLKRLCGDDAARNVVLVTTKWRNVTRSLGNEREQRLRKEWWNSLLDQGSRVARFEETRGSAWHIINLIVEKHPTRGASPDTEFTKWPFFTTQPPTFPSMTAPGKSNPKAEIIDDPTLMDIIILTIGIIGSGKSTFINAAAGEDITPVNHNLESSTKEIVSVAVTDPRDPSRRVVFVDTPGFNDPLKDDVEILEPIAAWLAQLYEKKRFVAGIVYLHEISRARLVSSSVLDMLGMLCGSKAAKNAILVTTKWGMVLESVGQKREQELSEIHFQSMLNKASTMAQFRDTHESAWDVVDSIVERKGVDALQIQRELVDFRKPLAETEAAKALGVTSSKALHGPLDKLARLAARLFLR